MIYKHYLLVIYNKFLLIQWNMRKTIPRFGGKRYMINQKTGNAGLRTKLTLSAIALAVLSPAVMAQDASTEADKLFKQGVFLREQSG